MWWLVGQWSGVLLLVVGELAAGLLHCDRAPPRVLRPKPVSAGRAYVVLAAVLDLSNLLLSQVLKVLVRARIFKKTRPMIMNDDGAGHYCKLIAFFGSETFVCLHLFGSLWTLRCALVSNT